MATGNLLLGYGRRSIGDITMYRTYGKQRARARNRNPKNPRTQAQQVQRAITATISKAYSQMKAICDHSFQGKSVGAENQQRFNKVNMDLLRANIVADINNETAAAECLGSVVKQGANFATLNNYIVAEGNLVQNLFDVVAVAGESLPFFKLKNISATTASMNVSEYLSYMNVREGDIFTIVTQQVIHSGGDFSSQYGQQASAPSTDFGFLRLIVKEPSTTIAMSAATLGDIFTIDIENIHDTGLSTQALVSTNAAEELNIETMNSSGIGSLAIIKSRKDSGERSFAQFVFVDNGTLVGYSKEGIKQMYLMNAWGDSVDAIGESTLILEGGGF